MKTLLNGELSQSPLFVIGLLLVIAVFGVIDLFLDAPETLWSLHVLFDLAFVLVAGGAAAYLWWGMQTTLGRMQRMAAAKELERDAWRERARTLLEGLGEAIDRQLREWKLTEAERATAIFLLKGYSHKEIARLTQRSERTVRQHAVVVYRKSGLAGRAELSAFFLEDLLLPRRDL